MKMVQMVALSVFAGNIAHGFPQIGIARSGPVAGKRTLAPDGSSPDIC
jgi:hypothetical protein